MNKEELLIEFMESDDQYFVCTSFCNRKSSEDEIRMLWWNWITNENSFRYINKNFIVYSLKKPFSFQSFIENGKKTIHELEKQYKK